MNELSNRELQVALNKVCFSSDFKMFFTARHHMCPRGMTIGVTGEPRGKYDFTEEHLATVLEYFKTHKPELYEKYMDGVTFYLGGI